MTISTKSLVIVHDERMKNHSVATERIKCKNMWWEIKNWEKRAEISFSIILLYKFMVLSTTFFVGSFSIICAIVIQPVCDEKYRQKYSNLKSISDDLAFILTKLDKSFWSNQIDRWQKLTACTLTVSTIISSYILLVVLRIFHDCTVSVINTYSWPVPNRKKEKKIIFCLLLWIHH